MTSSFNLLLLLFLFICAAGSDTVNKGPQRPLILQDSAQQQQQQQQQQTVISFKSARLKGRFLHITDAHLDPLYKAHASVKKRCHRGSGDAGYWGAPSTKCDGSVRLLDATFAWIRKYLVDDVDFVVWTGDAARHDSDKKHPRTAEDVIELNELLVNRVVKTLSIDPRTNSADGKRQQPREGVMKQLLQIPFVPNLGNNDFVPHNEFKDGPNKWTEAMSKVWERFIPEGQRDSFAQMGSFFVEVIPDRLAVVSVNSMYFFGSNSAAEGCYEPREPGYRQMEWLRVVLERFRERSMKALIIGHVPPARAGKRQNWDETCWQKYTLWLERFRDVVTGNLFAHMNIDHFQLHDFDELQIRPLSGDNPSAVVNQESRLSDPENVDIQGLSKKISYLESMRAQWAKLPPPSIPDGMPEKPKYTGSSDQSKSGAYSKGKKKGHKRQGRDPWGERFGLSLVSPSIIPNYFPSIRVFSYNISGLEDVPVWREESLRSISSDRGASDEQNVAILEDYYDEDSDLVELSDLESEKKKKKKGRKGEMKHPPPFNVPKPPSPTSLPGPAYSNQPLSLVSYTQYIANLTRLNAEVADAGNPNQGNFEYTVLYNTNDDVYGMDDLTVPSYLELARKLADGSKYSKKGMSENEKVDTHGKVKNGGGGDKNKTWMAFLERAFTGLYDDDELSR